MTNPDDSGGGGSERARNSSAYTGNNWHKRDSKTKHRSETSENLNAKFLRSHPRIAVPPEQRSGSSRYIPPPERHYRRVERELEHEPTIPIPITFPEPKAMKNAVRLIDDNDAMDFMDFCKEYLMDANRGFMVIGSIGAQSTGKSTLLSMLAANEPGDMYRQYVFRPFYRESSDSSRHQTTKIYVYINKWRTIFLDCQPIGSPTMLSEYLSSHRRLPRDQCIDQFELMSLQILTLMSRVCDTLILCVDWFIDMNVVGDLLRTELFKDKVANVSERKVNIVVLHQRAKIDAFDSLVMLERMRTLKGIFDNSSFDVCGGINLQSLGFSRYSSMNCSVNYVPLGEIPPLKFGRANSNVPGGLSENDNSSEVSYKAVIHALRTKLMMLPRHNGEMTELEWYTSTAKLWDCILKELKVGFNDSLRKAKFMSNPRHEKSRRDYQQRRERPEVAEDGVEANTSDMEKLSDGGNDHFTSHGRRQFVNRRYFKPAESGRTSVGARSGGYVQRYRRQFFTDERDENKSSANINPSIVKIIKKRRDKEPTPSDEEDYATKGDNYDDDDDGSDESAFHPTDDMEELAIHTDSHDDESPRCVPPRHSGEKLERERFMPRTMNKQMKSSRSSIYPKYDRNFNSREYEAIKKKIFSSIDRGERSSKTVLTSPIETPRKVEKEFRPKGLLKRSTSPETSADESLHDAFCSQELSDA